MSVSSFAGWLRCPACGRDVEPAGGDALRCETGHAFAVGRRGTVAFGPVRRDASAPSEDVLVRSIESGALAAVGRAIEAMLPRGAVLDLAAGLTLAPGPATAPGRGYLAAGGSPGALSAVVRRTGAPGLLLDAVAPIPVRDGAAQVAVVGFRPVRAEELHRILAPGGSLIVVATDADEPAGGLRASAVPTWELADALWSGFEHDQTRHVDADGVPVTVVRLRRRRRAL